jgi:hypothetical protein
MTRRWEARKEGLLRDMLGFAERSPVMSLKDAMNGGDQVSFVVEFATETLVTDPSGNVGLSGPVLMGLRYHSRFLSESPHPAEIACVLAPRRVHAPHAEPISGAMCLGHPRPGISLELILNQVWAALSFNMNYVNTSHGDVLNPVAAAYVRANAEKFPLHHSGLFEPLDPVSGHWPTFSPRKEKI